MVLRQWGTSGGLPIMPLVQLVGRHLDRFLAEPQWPCTQNICMRWSLTLHYTGLLLSICLGMQCENFVHRNTISACYMCVPTICQKIWYYGWHYADSIPKTSNNVPSYHGTNSIKGSYRQNQTKLKFPTLLKCLQGEQMIWSRFNIVITCGQIGLVHFIPDMEMSMINRWWTSYVDKSIKKTTKLCHYLLNMYYWFCCFSVTQ